MAIGAAVAWLIAVLTNGSLLGTGLILLILLTAKCGIVGGLATLAIGIYKYLRERMNGLAEQSFYGICMGHSDEREGATLPLTDWLHGKIQHLSGKTGEPLTFADLERKDIDLKMVTTNLSHEQPYIVPFEYDTFIFNEGDMRRLFPADVVDHMIAHALQPSGAMLPSGFHRLPGGKSLPVVVAARLSLSFPLLVSAVRFYTVNAASFAYLDKLTAADLQPNWFSDGGLCSNFSDSFLR